MLTAYNQDKNRIVLINKTKEELTTLHRKRYYCLSCNEELILKAGAVRKPHFAHRAGSCCTSFTENESEEHLSLKEAICTWCEKNQLAFQLEAYLPQLKQRPDILIDSYAIEIQCSPLPISRLLERTQNYIENGYTPVWMLGTAFQPRKKLTKLIKAFAGFTKEVGFYLWQLNWKEQKLCLYYHIEENNFGEAFFQTKAWPFYSENFAEILRSVKKKRFFHQRTYSLSRNLQKYYVDIQRNLQKKDIRYLKLQNIFYQKKQHLLYLPVFFYYAYFSYFYLKDGGCTLRLYLWQQVMKRNVYYLSLKELQESCQKLIEKEQLHFFHLFAGVTEEMLVQHFCENVIREWKHCGILMKNMYGWYFQRPQKITAEKELQEQLFLLKDKSFTTVTPTKM